MSDEMTFCVHCGPNIKIDDDGCCSSCGADAYGKGIEYIESLRAELNEAADATGIAGVDKPMSLLECIQSLRAELSEIKNNAFGLDDPDDEAILYGTPKACDIACRLWGEKDKRIEELESKIAEFIHGENEGPKRTEELEQISPANLKKSTEALFTVLREDGYHIITTEQIDEIESLRAELAECKNRCECLEVQNARQREVILNRGREESDAR